MLIENYGLFWRTDSVFWGKPKSAGAFYGVLVSAKKSQPVDFREQSGIYALYGNYELVYVGQTGGKGQKLMARLLQHRKDDLAGRWNIFSWFGTRAVLESYKLKAEKQGTSTTHQHSLRKL